LSLFRILFIKIKMENSKTKNNLPMILIILDGWGLAKPSKGNAVSLAKTPNLDSYYKKYPWTKLYAHNKYVGLPLDQDGNSEAGHMNIGAGRVVEQDAVTISRDINRGAFFRNPVFIQAIRHAKKNKSRMHLMGMLSNGMSAHSHPDHFLSLIELLKRRGVENVALHLFTDGRDSPQYSALKLVEDVNKILKNKEQIATIMGRFYAMDRKKKWQRTELAYDALVLGKGRLSASVHRAITESYNRGDSDEFIEPYVIAKSAKSAIKMGDGDSVIFFNLRSDRARQLTKAFAQEEFNRDNPGAFKRKKVLKNLCFAAMTDFGPDLGAILTAYPSINLKNTLPMIMDNTRQVYVSETEKRAHVTYFFNGGYAGKVAGEDYFIVSSPDVKSYDQTPGMSSEKLTEVVLKNLKSNKYDFTVLNYAAPDMVGHSGNLSAGIKCCEIIDKEVGKLARAYTKAKGTVIITADHGNIEEMINLKTGEIDTEHSANQVPFILISGEKKFKLIDQGVLADIAPTILGLLGYKKPREMTGRSLIK